MPVVAVVVSCFLAWCALVWLQLRHAALSVLVLAVPALMLGYIALGDVAAFLKSYSSAVFFASATAALAVGDWIVRAVCKGSTSREAGREALRRLAVTMAPVFAVYALAMAAFSYRLMPARFAVASAASLAIAFGVVAGVVLIASRLAYSEAFIARANAARERRERAMERLAFVVERRWAFSIAGIAAILATLSGFAIRDLYPAHPVPSFWPYLGAVEALVLAGSILAARDWRAGIAAALAYALATALLFAAQERGGAPEMDIFLAFDSAVAVLMPSSIVASGFRMLRREGEDIAQALTTALREEGGLVCVAALLWLVPGVPAAIGLGIVSPLLALGIAIIVAVPLLFPALTVAIHTLLPRYRSVDEVFGKR